MRHRTGMMISDFPENESDPLMTVPCDICDIETSSPSGMCWRCDGMEAGLKPQSDAFYGDDKLGCDGDDTGGVA